MELIVANCPSQVRVLVAAVALQLPELRVERLPQVGISFHPRAGLGEDKQGVCRSRQSTQGHCILSNRGIVSCEGMQEWRTIVVYNMMLCHEATQRKFKLPLCFIRSVFLAEEESSMASGRLGLNAIQRRASASARSRGED